MLKNCVLSLERSLEFGARDIGISANLVKDIYESVIVFLLEEALYEPLHSIQRHRRCQTSQHELQSLTFLLLADTRIQSRNIGLLLPSELPSCLRIISFLRFLYSFAQLSDSSLALFLVGVELSFLPSSLPSLPSLSIPITNFLLLLAPGL